MSHSIFEQYAALREKYPDDIKDIEAEEARVSDLLKKHEYAALAPTKELLALCRKDIVWARVKLASDRELDEVERAGLWGVIDSRRWVLDQLAIDFAAQVQLIETELAAELSR